MIVFRIEDTYTQNSNCQGVLAFDAFCTTGCSFFLLQVTKNRFDGDLGVAPLTWDKESCTMSGHFNRPPPQSVAHNKTLTDSPGKLPSPHPRTVKELAFGTYRPQGSKLIGRTQNTPVKGTSSGSPLINQASTTSHGPSRRTV